MLWPKALQYDAGVAHPSGVIDRICDVVVPKSGVQGKLRIVRAGVVGRGSTGTLQTLCFCAGSQAEAQHYGKNKQFFHS